MPNNSPILIIPSWLYWQIWRRIICHWAPLTSICWVSSNLRFWISFILVHNFNFGIFMKRYFINQDKDIKSRSLNNLSIKIEVRSMTDYSSYKSLTIRALPWCGKLSNGLVISKFTTTPILMDFGRLLNRRKPTQKRCYQDLNSVTNLNRSLQSAPKLGT